MKNDWIKIKNYYVSHEISLEQLAKKFKVSVSTVEKRSSREKWKELKKQTGNLIEEKLQEKTIQSVVNRKVAANEKHNELFDKGLEVAELLLKQYLSDLHEGKKKTKATAYNLDFVMKAIINAQKGQRQALNIDDKEDVENEPEVRIISGISIKDI